ncbi:hypothetical protein BHE74_00015745 [Ensete ventricosum]|nr:hypothetical protein BHE74_00015745 [Ensete ventricosum]
MQRSMLRVGTVTSPSTLLPVFFFFLLLLLLLLSLHSLIPAQKLQQKEEKQHRKDCLRQNATGKNRKAPSFFAAFMHILHPPPPLCFITLSFCALASIPILKVSLLLRKRLLLYSLSLALYLAQRSHLLLLFSVSGHKMGENGNAKHYQQPAVVPVNVSIELGHAHRLEDAFECYDDDGRLKRTGKDHYFASSSCRLRFGAFFVSWRKGWVFVHVAGTVWTASAHIVTAVIGSGVLSLAWAIAQLGWVAGPVVMLLFSLVTYYTSTLLADCYRSGDPISGKRNYKYTDAVHAYLGELADPSRRSLPQR